MSGLSREQNYEVKYLRKVLLEVDERIELPATLRADALRHKLDNITPAPEPVTAVKLLKPKRFFTWQSGLTYAAAFLLIVGLFYGWGFNKSAEVVEGEIPIDELQAEDNGGTAMFAETDAFDDVRDDTAASDRAATESATAPDVGGDGGETEQAEPEWGVGGAAQSVRIGSMNNYVLTYRENDQSDPDKANYPISLEVLSSYDDRLIAQVDLSLEAVEFHNVNGNMLMLAGETDSGVGIYVLDMADMENPVRTMLIEQQGAYHSARVYEGMLHVVSRTVQVEQLEVQTETLPDAANQQVAHVITALDLETLQTTQKAFIGDGELKLQPYNCYVNYTGTQQAEEYVAMIRLDGLDMSVGSVS